MKVSRFLLGTAVAFLLTVGLAAAEVEHVVQQGETAYHIARAYGIPVKVLLSVNKITDARDLRVGTVLKIPSLYVVKRGDTLYGIAQECGVTLQSLLTLNRLQASHILKVGQTLVLPRSAHAPSKAQPVVATSLDDAASSAADGDAVAQSAPESSPDALSSGQSPFWPHPGKRVLLAGKLAGGAQIWGREGDPILSVSSGRVVWVGPYRGYGRVVFVESARSYIYVYGGGERTLVRVGEEVSPGTEVAQMGINPRLGQALTYFFVYRDGKPVDPETAPRG